MLSFVRLDKNPLKALKFCNCKLCLLIIIDWRIQAGLLTAVGCTSGALRTWCAAFRWKYFSIAR